jgi:flagellar secretion chaperone FliS
MTSPVHDAYLETQVNTATPQRLRLMLIDEAHRRAGLAEAAWKAGKMPEGEQATRHCREIISELIAGIRPDDNPLAKRVLGIYVFLFSMLTEAQLARDAGRLRDVLRILEAEQLTWRAVCEQMPERPIAPAKPAAEELAPQRVTDGWASGYDPRLRPGTTAPALSIEA